MNAIVNVRNESGQILRYASGYHAPVLCNAVIQGLVTRLNGTYVDATLGGGGHSAALLDALSEKGRVIAIDQDDEAIAEASSRLHNDLDSGRLRLLEGNFSDTKLLLESADIDNVDGLLLDLGVSSHQLDDKERGFSHRGKGPIDMRMDRSKGSSAHELINQAEAEELSRIMRWYGEEPHAGRIARAILAARPIENTEELAALVRQCAPRGKESKTLSRVFQALRIAVNDELEALDVILQESVAILPAGARLAVISYHSLEDRRVKRFMRSGNFRGEVLRDIYGNKISPWKEVTRKPIMAEEEEIVVNPRSRSARLRIAERVIEGGTTL